MFLPILITVAALLDVTQATSLVDIKMYTHVWWSGCSDEKTALASVLSSSHNLSNAINFTLYPVPDPIDKGKKTNPTTCDKLMYPKSVCTCEIHEACAVHVTGCANGCSGKSLDTLATFLGCYVKGNPTMEDNCGPQHLEPCIAASGINKSEMLSCIKTKSTYAPVVTNAY